MRIYYNYIRGVACTACKAACTLVEQNQATIQVKSSGICLMLKKIVCFVCVG